MLEILSEINIYSVTLRMFLALVFGGIIGIERGMRNRPAGFLTYVLVCCTSSLIMITNLYLVKLYPNIDPTRLAAQIVSGIGFLGAGTIITTKKNEIRGLTTAAGLWSVAGIGIAVGSGFYVGACVGMFFILVALLLLRKVDLYVKQHAKSMEIYIEYDTHFTTHKLIELTELNHFTISDIEIGRIKTLAEEYGTMTFSLEIKGKENHMQVLEKIRKLKGIRNIREVF
ncbi:MAG: MgtC/SapB family protein [Clostridia bacterium]|nr:MgtC/SapB family protein [Clostridia bacterium]NCC42651.1 MgtC/SapB family protein [Clostridia bacterium]